MYCSVNLYSQLRRKNRYPTWLYIYVFYSIIVMFIYIITIRSVLIHELCCCLSFRELALCMFNISHSFLIITLFKSLRSIYVLIDVSFTPSRTPPHRSIVTSCSCDVPIIIIIIYRVWLLKHAFNFLHALLPCL